MVLRLFHSETLLLQYNYNGREEFKRGQGLKAFLFLGTLQWGV